ncbi:histidine phosphatase family protein [Bdellovibrio sp. NC01]|uniref:histidine phosphatase family protein n=1 Tax=Bdellovibrio sp. NC01 TaxID=2220073 RepID=UPI00115B7925|nr:histidine phosphatase family protein [Bdellovibrio sp. NC01]QDK37483.1 hypothetical protein DOE51_07750 [Bdellovibrio sp. NC01]
MSKVIHLFRHGQTDWNIGRRLQGHTDIPLNSEGRKQAETLQEYFAKNPVELIFSSDLSRAKETAAIANLYQQAPAFYFNSFREVKLGEIEGLTYDQILAAYGEEAWQKWQSIQPENYHFAFKDGEPAFAALKRFKEALEKCCREYDFTAAGLCTHGLMMRRFIHSLRPDLKEPMAVPNCSVFAIHWEEDKGFSFPSEV